MSRAKLTDLMAAERQTLIAALADAVPLPPAVDIPDDVIGELAKLGGINDAPAKTLRQLRLSVVGTIQVCESYNVPARTAADIKSMRRIVKANMKLAAAIKELAAATAAGAEGKASERYLNAASESRSTPASFDEMANSAIELAETMRAISQDALAAIEPSATSGDIGKRGPQRSKYSFRLLTLRLQAHVDEAGGHLDVTALRDALLLLRPYAQDLIARDPPMTTLRRLHKSTKR